MQSDCEVPLLCCATEAARAAAVDLLQTWDGSGGTPEAWHDQRAEAVAVARAVVDAARREEHEAEIAAWGAETESRKEERRATCEEDEYASSDEECPHPSDVTRCRVCPATAAPAWDGTYVVDSSPFVLPIRRTGIPFAAHMEATREKVVRCMRAGGTLVIDLRDMAVDWETKVFAPKHKGAFPRGLIAGSGHNCWTAASKTAFVRAKGDGRPEVKLGFKVVLVANRPWVKLEQQLRPSLSFAWQSLEPLLLKI